MVCAHQAFPLVGGLLGLAQGRWEDRLGPLFSPPFLVGGVFGFFLNFFDISLWSLTWKGSSDDFSKPGSADLGISAGWP